MAATAGASASPCASFVEETLLLPTRNARLFAPVFAVVFAHTFVFLAVAVLLAHPLASVQLDDGLSAWRDAVYALSAERIREHAVALLLLYLAYLAGKLATQATVALAASATLRGSGDNRPCSLAGLSRDKAPRGLFTGVALVAAVELASSAIPAACLASWWSYGAAHSDTGGVESFVQGLLLFLFLLALLFRLVLAAVFQVAIAALASGEEGCNGGNIGASVGVSITAGADHRPAWSLLVGVRDGTVLRLKRLLVARAGSAGTPTAMRPLGNPTVRAPTQ